MWQVEDLEFVGHLLEELHVLWCNDILGTITQVDSLQVYTYLLLHLWRLVGIVVIKHAYFAYYLVQVNIDRFFVALLLELLLIDGHS